MLYFTMADIQAAPKGTDTTAADNLMESKEKVRWKSDMTKQIANIPLS